MRRITLFTLTLLGAACGVHQHEAPPAQDPPKSAVDVALGCLTELQTCEDWEPTRGPKLEPRICNDPEEDCKVTDWECKDEARRCRRHNVEDANRIFDSKCQRKATSCVRLVEAVAPKEIHHHR